MKLLSETKRTWYQSLPYRAKPYNNNLIGAALFKNAKEATEYLNQYTGYTMDREDWKITGKIEKYNRSTSEYMHILPHNDIDWGDYGPSLRGHGGMQIGHIV